MLRDLTNPKKIDKQAVLAAIALLRSRAWDINPYTVADEMKTSHTNIYRNSEAMELVNEARQQAGLPMIHVVDDAAPEATEAEQSITALQDRIQQLETENAELQELQKDNWQRGYKAGWDEASIYLTNAAPFPTESHSEVTPQDDAFTPIAEQAPEVYSSDNNFESNAQVYDNEFDSGILPEASTYQDYSYIDKQDDSEQETPQEAWTDNEQFASEEIPEEGSEETISTEELQNILKQHRDKTEGDPTQAKAKGLAASKFARTPNEPPQRGFILRTVPPDIRKSCLVLGIRPEELSRQAINEAWKREITRPGTHPDQGGDSEIAVYLNTAKDVLLGWWETQEPKLGKQFGSQSKQTPAGTESEPDETEPSL